MGIFSSLAQTFSTPNPSQKPRGPYGDDAAADTDLKLNNIYTPDPNNWYTAKPYGFRFTSRKTGRQATMFMPINPSNLNISTSFATNVIPTLYGTVEEHSDVRYFDIVIEGTTGMVPKFVKPGFSGNVVSTSETSDATDVTYAALLQPGRAAYPIANAAALGGFFSNTVAQISNVLNQAGKAVSAITGQANQPVETGVYNNQTGYLAFHNLYRFLLKYKKDAAGVDSHNARIVHPLTFFNYKDGNEYDVAIKNFTLRRSAENPMLYYYSITMRGYNIRSCGGLKALEDLNQRLNDLGLNGVQSSSLLSTVSGISNNAKAVVGSAVNGVNLFGR
jgi:hypothetical protein